jgi:two-component system OmpR family sensor kinase
MTRHFLGLYLLIVVTLAIVSWGQDRLLQAYSSQESTDERSLAIAMAAFESQLHAIPSGEWKARVAAMAGELKLDLELFANGEIAGSETLAKLNRGGIARMQASTGQSWTLKQIDPNHVLALKSFDTRTQPSVLEWALTAFFYAVIALVIMIWIWPLRRDLRALERAAARFGDRNWQFNTKIKTHSQIFPLAETFRRMAARIDGLVASHKDMSNAVSHEIKTPLARMQFEIEMAQHSQHLDEVRKSLNNIKADIAAINDLVTATLNYAILERADLSLNLGTHDFTALIPAIADHVRRDARPEIHVESRIEAGADKVVCDLHMVETALRNLLYNAVRYAKREVRVSFSSRDGQHELSVEDDGPGIPEQDRERVFESFVQLERAGTEKKSGFGLGLAIVRRAFEWHAGSVVISQSTLGGARFCATWPATLPRS